MLRENKSLYDIRCRFIELLQNDELSEEEVNELGLELGKELQMKSKNIAGYIVDAEAFLERIEAEEKRLAEMKKVGKAKLERFKGYVKDNMVALDLPKIQTELGTLTVAKNPLSVEIVELDKVPQEFLKQEIKITADKTAIKEHFKATGEIPEGCAICDNKTSLRVK